MAFPQVDVARARAFVLAHGGAVDVARMEGLLGRTEPDRAVIRALERLQNPDGGFPIAGVSGGPAAEHRIIAVADGVEQAHGVTAEAGGREANRCGTSAADAPAAVQEAGSNCGSSVAATCQVLARLRDIPPLAGSPMASRAVAFLRRSQNVDGSWSEAQDKRESVYLTALAAYTLAVMEPDHPDPIVRAAKWLRRTLVDEHAHSQTLFLAAAVWGHTGNSGAQDSAYALLEKRDLAAYELAGWLTTLGELGLAARHFALVLRLLERLDGMQQADGSWPGGDDTAVEATLAALRVFRRFGLAGE